ncbi:MAG: hypothetical protein ACE5K1_04325 [Acidiferrobacterales bacterium]
MSTEANKKLVEQFYHRVWNQWDRSAVEELLAPDIAFRGSLGA